MSSVHSIPEYHVWKQLRQRCQNTKHKQYRDYGGRGIKVCDRWSSFWNFIADMGRRPAGRFSIERRNNDKDYEPGNCYWATDFQQGGNKRNNIKLTRDGRTMCLSAWCRELGLNYQTVKRRVMVYGIPTEVALTAGCLRPGPKTRQQSNELFFVHVNSPV